MGACFVTPSWDRTEVMNVTRLDWICTDINDTQLSDLILIKTVIVRYNHN